MTSDNKSNNKSLVRWNHWAAIASSIAAIVSLALLGYQLWTDRPYLKIDLKGAAFADYHDRQNVFIAVWIDAFNQGKRPAGIIKSNLNIKFWDHTRLELEEIPVFPRFTLDNLGSAPAIESPFFYEPSFYDNFVKDKSGKAQPFDYHPKTLQYVERTFNIGTYHSGYMIFKLGSDARKKFLHDTEKNILTLILYTTDKKRLIPIKKLNKWKQETFGKRFFIIKPAKANDVR